MRRSKHTTLLLGLTAGVAYTFLTMWLVTMYEGSVSFSYIFVLPIVMGAVPVLFSTKEQLQSYTSFLLLPWGITLTCFWLAILAGIDGLACLTVIVAPFLALGTLGGFVFRLIRLKKNGPETKLYLSLLVPFVFLLLESNIQPSTQLNTVTTSVEIDANRQTVWENVKNVRNIQPSELQTHFVHVIGIPKPISGELNNERIGGVRKITWEKGIKFEELITSWNEGYGFTYDIHVDPRSIPPTTLDEHVVIGGKYFDVLHGGYKIDVLGPNKCLVTLSCTYRVTTNLNFYSALWADFILDDFNDMILDVIKQRCEI